MRITWEFINSTMKNDQWFQVRYTGYIELSVRSIPIYPANLATFEENRIFERPNRPFWTPAAPKRNMM